MIDMRETKKSLEFDDSIFIGIASNLGIEIIVETIETIVLDREESGLECILKEDYIPDKMIRANA